MKEYILNLDLNLPDQIEFFVNDFKSSTINKESNIKVVVVGGFGQKPTKVKISYQNQ